MGLICAGQYDIIYFFCILAVLLFELLPDACTEHLINQQPQYLLFPIFLHTKKEPGLSP
ncbi:hypothetical protein SAMN04487866_101417 [Thermoactinomyces sp. DSM 45891]|nr:hypothetical protein SAMN04487866_101417 [Thermoactinomyces sp. DSM 45891]